MELVAMTREMFEAEGFTHCSGWYRPVLSSVVYQRQHEYDTTSCGPFKVKVVGVTDSIDDGAFCINSVQCKVVLGSEEGLQKLYVVVDADTHWANSQNWWTNTTKPVKKRGQIFLWSKDHWEDVVDDVSMAEIRANFEAKKAEKNARWAELYSSLLAIDGMTKKDARKQMHNYWVEVEEFIRFAGELQKINPSPRRLRYAAKASAKVHIENVLGISCCRLAGALNAIAWYQQTKK